MAFSVSCPKCGKTYRVKSEQASGSMRCQGCQTAFRLSHDGKDKKLPPPRLPRMKTARRPEEGSSDTDTDAESTDTKQPVQKPVLQKIGRFEIRELVGKGSFGSVHRAYDPILDREVALKIPHVGRVSSETDAKNFLREPKAAAQLWHPHIVPVYDTGEDDGQYYIASAFIKGQTLQQLLNESQMDNEQIANFVAKIADALSYAASQSIIHRDVKPANIMIDTRGEPHLMDFGIAKIEKAGAEQDNRIAGTPAYMSPEQTDPNVKLTPATDQYSLGVIMYEMLCGKMPFSGRPEAVIYKVQNEEPQRPRSISKSVNRDLESICLKAMEKDRDDRYESCVEMAKDLRRWLDHLPVKARVLSPTERFRRWCGRGQWGATFFFAFIITLIVGFTATMHFIEESRLQKQTIRDLQSRVNSTPSDVPAKQNKPNGPLGP